MGPAGWSAGWTTRAALVAVGLTAATLTLTSGLLPCPMAAVLHVPCPGCGLTRATLALAHGDPGAALRFHPLVPVIVPVLAVYLGGNALGYVASGRWGALDRRVGRAGAVVLAGVGVLSVAVWLARLGGWLGGPVAIG